MRQNRTKQLLNYWMELFEKQGNASGQRSKLKWPDRNQISPSECKDLLGDMFILDTSSGFAEFRLAGTRLCNLYGRELKYEFFSEHYDGADQHSAEGWSIRLGLDEFVVLICSIGETKSGRLINLETLLLPLEYEGQNGQRALGITVPAEQALWIGSDPLQGQSIRSVRVMHPWQEKSQAMTIEKNVRRELRKPNSEQPFVNPTIMRTPMHSPAFDQAQSDLEALTRIMQNSHHDGEIGRQVEHLRVIDGGRS